MKRMNTFKASLLILPVLTSCSVDLKKIEAKATMINHYEQISLRLTRDNRELHAKVKRLEFEIQKLKQDNSFQASKMHGSSTVQQEVTTHASEAHESVTHGRSIASVPPSITGLEIKKDFVEFKTYKWQAVDLMKIADKEFKDKNYEKAAQFYTSLINNYPTNKSITDEFYFKAGIAAFESGSHHEWTLTHFEALMNKYPTSKYYRSAKLWVALTHMKMGDNKKFYTTVEEFRKKYRNTNEWKILSSYYEKIEEKKNE